MTQVWELQIEGTGSGWKGWRVTFTTDSQTASYSYDERDGVHHPEEALNRALDTESGQAILENDPEVTMTEIRTVISAEVNPN